MEHHHLQKPNDENSGGGGQQNSEASSSNKGGKGQRRRSSSVENPTKKNGKVDELDEDNEDFDEDDVQTSPRDYRRRVTLDSRKSEDSGPARSVGVSVKMNNSTTRTRIDNLGRYHEYPYRASQEVAALKHLKTPLVVPWTGDKKLLGTVPKSFSDTHSHVIMNEIRGFISADAPVIITPLMTTSKLFIRKCQNPSLPPALSKKKGSFLYEVLNHQMTRIFFLKQTGSTSILSFLFLYGFVRQTFQYTVLDKSGRPALVVDGKQYVFGVYVTSTIKYADKSFLGQMKQSICDGSYKINDDKDRIMFTLVGPVFSCYAPCVFYCFDEEFEIFLSGSADEVGRIAKFWKADELQQGHSYIGASFPLDMSIRSKAILFGALLTMRWQYFVRGGNGLIVVVIYLLVIACGCVIYLYVNHHI